MLSCICFLFEKLNLCQTQVTKNELDSVYGFCNRVFFSVQNSYMENELKLLKSVFDIYSDGEIYEILTNKIRVNIELKNLFEKILKF